MIIYAILMFIISCVFTVIGILIYKGNTNLIHSYHQTKVKDKAAYGKAFGKTMFVFAASTFASGLIGALGENSITVAAADLVLISGIAVGVICIILVQKKYNKGLF